MKKSMFAIIATCIVFTPQVLNAKCATVAIATGSNCIASGGVICPDGGCYSCCDSSTGGDLTPCSGTYTTNTSTTFSDTKGSGYVEKRRYSAVCACLY